MHDRNPIEPVFAENYPICQPHQLLNHANIAASHCNRGGYHLYDAKRKGTVRKTCSQHVNAAFLISYDWTDDDRARNRLFVAWTDIPQFSKICALRLANLAGPAGDREAREKSVTLWKGA